MARFESAAGICAAAFVAAVAWALLRFGANAIPDLYLFFLALAAITLGAGGLLPAARMPGPAGALFGLAFAVLLAFIAFGPSLEGQGFVFYAIGGMSLYLGARLAATGPAAVRIAVVGVLLLGAFQAAYGLVQALVGHDFIGSYHRDLGRIATGTLINRNHFAAFLNLVLPLGLSMLLMGSSREGSSRAGSERLARLWLGVSASALMAVAVLLSLSRGGTLILLVVIAYLAAALYARRRRRRGGAGSRGALWILVLLVLALGLAIGLEALGERFARVEGELTRVEIYQDTLELIADHPLLGIGPGMYRWRFRPYQTAQPEGWYEHAHNDYLETAAEWGVPLALLLWLAAWWVWWGIARSSWRESRTARASLFLGISASLLSVLVHSLVDFVLRTPTNLAVTAFLFGAGWRLSRSQEGARVVGRRPRLWLRVALAGLLVVAGWRVVHRYRAAALTESATGVEELDRALAWDPESPEALFRRGLLERDALGRAATARSSLEAAVELNPDYWTYRLELARTYELLGEDERAARSYDRALELNPQGSAFYWNLANFRLRRGRLENAIESAGRAVALDRSLAEAAFRLLRRAGVSTEEIAAAWPEDRWMRLRLLGLAIDDGMAGAALIEAQWRGLLAERPPPEIEDTGFLFRHLVEAGLEDAARSFWIELQGLHGVRDPEFERGANLVWNGSFALEPSRHPMDWAIHDESEHASVGRVDSGGERGSVLRVEFDGAENLDYRGVEQRLLVPPGADFGISAALRSEAISSDQGIYIQVVGADGRELWASPGLVGSRDWHAVEGSFRDAGAGSRVAVRLRRRPSRLIDGRLGGTVWLDAVVVRPLVEREESAE